MIVGFSRAAAAVGSPFVAAGAVAGSSSGAITPGLPAGWQVNDVFIMFGFSVTAGQSSPAGWTLIRQIVHGSYYFSAWYRRAVSGDSAPTISSTGYAQAAVIGAWRGCITSNNPIGSSNVFPSAAGSGDTATLSSIITLAANDEVVCAVINNGDGGALNTYSSWSCGSSTPNQEFSGKVSGQNVDFVIADFLKAAAGSTGSGSVTASASSHDTLYGALIELIMPPNARAFSASGAATTSCNGDYYQAGTYNSKPYYMNASGIYLYYVTNYWCFSSSLGTAHGDALYVYFSTAATPPTVTYTAVLGSSPGPTLAAG